MRKIKMNIYYYVKRIEETTRVGFGIEERIKKVLLQFQKAILKDKK